MQDITPLQNNKYILVSILPDWSIPVFGSEYPNTEIVISNGKINVHDFNHCFNFATNKTSTKYTKYCTTT